MIELTFISNLVASLDGQNFISDSFIGEVGNFNLLRIAIVGSLIVGLALLSGLAVLKRNALAYSTTIMVGTVAALESFWLGFLPAPGTGFIILLQGIFGASVIIFLSASVRVARNNALLGGVMFAASLVFLGIGLINFLGRADFGALMIPSLVGVGGFAFILSIVQSLRGDSGAQIILPGACLTLAALFIFMTQGTGGLLGHGLLTIGLLTGSMIALTGNPVRSTYRYDMGDAGYEMAYNNNKVGQHDKSKMAGNALLSSTVHNTSKSNLTHKEQLNTQSNSRGGSDHIKVRSLNNNLNNSLDTVAVNAQAMQQDAPNVEAGDENLCEIKKGRKLAVSTDRLVEVLDFSGIAVWDWSLDGVYQSQSLCTMMGSDCEADFTPEAMRAFINPSHLSVFEKDILGHGAVDGGFDAIVLLHNNEPMRIRGARAVDNHGRLERVVAFFETIEQPADATNGTGLLLHPDQDFTSPDQSSFIVHSDTKTQNAIQGSNVSQAQEDNQSTYDKEINDQDEVNKSKSALSFQPMIAFGSREIVGYEVKPALSSQGPMDVTVDEVINRSASFLADEHQKSRKLDDGHQLSSDAFVAMGVSYEQLIATGFVDVLQNSVKQNGLPYGALVLEISHLAAITNVRAAKSLFGDLRQGGIRLAFADADGDIGVLGNLHRYDFEYIKIDHSIVTKANDNYDAGQLSRTLIALGRDLGIRVFASGVETSNQLKLMTELGCVYGVGDALAASIPQVVGHQAVGHQAVSPNKRVESSKTLNTEDSLLKEDDHRVETLERRMGLTDHKSSQGDMDSLQTQDKVKEEKIISLDEWGQSHAQSQNQSPNQSLGKAPLKEPAVAFDTGARDFNQIAVKLEPQSQPKVSAQDIAQPQEPLQNLEAAFTNSVPSFNTDPKLASVDDTSTADLKAAQAAPREESTLPKWRTWVSNMR